MTHLINRLDLLRSGKLKELLIDDHRILYCRGDRFAVIHEKYQTILREWDVISLLSKVVN